MCCSFIASPASGKLGLRMMSTLHEEPTRRTDDVSAPVDTPTEHVSTLIYYPSRDLIP